jgi:Zn ribbon nucleic-acid-binding protein
MFYSGSTIVFSDQKGFGERYFIVCPVCWNASIRITLWEDGSMDEDDCGVCARMIRSMDVSE